MGFGIRPIWEHDNYTAKETYIIANIYEYDISKANISILLSLGWITPELYNELLACEKQVREVRIGLMIRDNQEMNQALSMGFKEFRRRLFEANDISNEEVVSIKKDAVFVTRELQYTNFDYVHFTKKNHYTMFYRLKNLEIWYGDDPYGNVSMDIKGIKDALLLTYDCEFIRMLMSIFIPMSHRDIRGALTRYKMVLNLYTSGNAPLSAYRELNSSFMFKIRGSHYRALLLTEEARTHLDISYNLMLLGILKQTLVNMFLEGK